MPEPLPVPNSERFSTSAFDRPGLILIVDDDPGPRKLAAHLLAEQHHLVLEAETGEDGLRLAQQRTPDLLLLDIKLPGIDGFEVCRRLRADPATEHIPVILLTVLADSEAHVRGLECGANDFLTKPADSLVLAARVRALLKYRRAVYMLQQAQTTLEARVAERTAELSQALDELKREAEERQRAEAVVEEREEQLRQAAKMEAVGRLAGGVAHDFNNLLTIILGHDELLLSRLTSSDPLHIHLEEIHKAASRAATLVRQMLAFGRRQMLQPKVLELNAVVLESQRLIRPLLGENIEMIVKLDPALGKTKADPTQLQQVILNLAVNACDAMTAGGTLTVETANVELFEPLSGTPFSVPPGSYATLALTDTGTGMPPEVQARLFEPFFTTKDVGRGTGLGLASVYGFVRQSGGHIWVESAVGKGSTFRLFLPRVVLPTPPAGPPVQSPGKVEVGHETLLLVEDDDGVRTFLRDFLLSRGYRVLEARDGLQAIEVCARALEPVHLLVTDVRMPRMDGRELSQRLSERHPNLRTLFVTGYADEVPEAAGSVVLQKPFPPEHLARCIREILDH
jgi:two-component system cell cycle sensor histidine kinase/response regulator CckA